MSLSDAKREALRARIERRRAELAIELRDDAEKLAGDRASRLDGESAERNAADLLAEVDQAELNRDRNELLEVEAALARLDNGTYGDCVDCDQTVGAARLEAYPAAARCVACQGAFEARHPGAHPASV